MSPVAALFSWFKENEHEFAASCGEVEFKNIGHGSACVNLGASDFLVSIAAWNHAMCLDILIMEVRTEECFSLHTGDCDSIEEFQQHLNTFCCWLEKRVRKGA